VGRGVTRGRLAFKAAILALLATGLVAPRGIPVAAAAPPGVVPAVDADPAPEVFETTLVSHPATADIGNGADAEVWTFNGTVPGPEIRVNVGDTLVVHYRNELPLPSGIHVHGIELNNASDGSALTQDPVPPGGSFLYRFQVPRPGQFWYHPHHHPTNQVFRGLYGSLVVADPHEGTLIAHGVLPSRDRTRTLVLSDTTVCKEPGRNDTDTYDDSLPWLDGLELPEQPGPFPSDLCDRPVDDHGTPIRDAAGRPVALRADEIPNIQRTESGRTNEGQTVLANGRNPGARAGRPGAPGALAPGAATLDVPAGQGLRLQVVNTATIRYMRLRLTDTAGNRIPLVRVGGEGGLLDRARVEGNPPGGVPGVTHFDAEHDRGEIVLGPADRADLVVALPAGTPRGVATLWTLDYSRTGQGYALLPTVPVMHLDVTEPAGTPYAVAEGTPLRTHPAVADPVEALGPPPGIVPDATGISALLDPAAFTPPKPGTADEDIRFTLNGTPSMDLVTGNHEAPGGDYRGIPHTPSTRYARLGDLLELTVTNTTAAHHVFHLHGFSFQPLELTQPPLVGEGYAPAYRFDYHEFVDTVDIPSEYSLRFRVRLDDRPQPDGTTPGGGLGRWVVHCHLLFHASLGMHSELVVVAPDGNEVPFVDADVRVVDVDEGATPSATGTYADPDGDPVALSASAGTVTDTGEGRWEWSGAPVDGSTDRTVYITATDSAGFRKQAAFALDVRNLPPQVAVTAPPSYSGLQVGSAVTVTAAVTDPGGPAPLSCRFDWDGAGPGPPVPVVNGTCADSRTFHAPGIHVISVIASDGGGGADAHETVVAVYDPDGGFVTGSGTTGAGDAFDVSVRHPRPNRPPGGHVVVGDFTSTTLHWLVVAGNTAYVHGTGTSGASFLLAVIDGSPDRLGLRVWPSGGAPADHFADPPPVAGGSVVVHRV
jgi:FtsP/CotA-like multicopper oxidase with cupredoxin domain